MATPQDVSTFRDTHVSGGSAVLGNIYEKYTIYQQNAVEDPKRKLLSDLYFDTMDSRRDNVHSAEARTCDWIWETAFCSWVRSTNPDSNVFWICGKPGSGKSTLMKYLSTARRLQLELPDKKWNVVDFFFDFRQKDRLGNTFEGLLRSLLAQIIEGTPSIPLPVIEKAKRSRNPSMGAMMELFRMLCHDDALHLFIIIDGLDEYTGNMRALMQFFTSHAQWPNVKICLASRPDPTVDVMAGPVRMHMSDHNLDGIQKYIALSTRPFITDENENHWKKVCAQLEERADGVFLWVYLVIDEIIQAFIVGEKFDKIISKLDNMPAELHALYQRVFDAIPNNMEIEASIVFELLEKAELPLNIGQLHGMLLLLSRKCSLECEVEKVTSQDSFVRRLQSAGGMLLHLRKQEPVKSQSRLIHDSINIDLVEYGTSVTHVNLMHRTVSSFIKRSGWSKKRLPQCLTRLLPSHVCRTIAAEAVLFIELIFRQHIEDILCKVGREFCSMMKFKAILSTFTKDQFLIALVPLVHFGILQVVPGCISILEHGHEEDEGLILFQSLLQSRLAALHYVVSWSHCQLGELPLSKYLYSHFSDVIIAAAHKSCRYLKSQWERIKALKDHQRASILVQLLSMANTNLCRTCEHVFTDSFVRSEAILTLVTRLLSEQQLVTSFHVAIHLMVGSLGSVRFTLTSEHLIALTQSPRIVLPSWNTALQQALVGGNPVFIWACRNSCNSIFGVEKDARVQLRTLLALGFSINHSSEDGTSLCHYLISTHLLEHVLGLPRAGRLDCGCDGTLNSVHEFGFTLNALAKLYMVEEYGANFDTLNPSGRNLLQAFHHGRSRLLKRLQKDIVSAPEYGGPAYNILELYPDIFESILISMDEFGFVLSHKSIHGHLPQPMVDAWDLKHYHCRPRRSCQLCEPDPAGADEVKEAEYCEECDGGAESDSTDFVGMKDTFESDDSEGRENGSNDGTDIEQDGSIHTLHRAIVTQRG